MTNLNVFDMAKEYDNMNDDTIDDLFMDQEEVKPAETDNTVNEVKNNEPWTPDESLLEDMPELTSTAPIYSKDEMIMEEDDNLKNVVDDEAKRSAIETMDEMHRTAANIEEAKKRHGILKLQIDPQRNIECASLQAKITAAAADTNYKRAQEGLDEIFNYIKTSYPDLILEMVDDNMNTSNNEDVANIHIETSDKQSDDQSNIIAFDPEDTDVSDVKVVIDKSQLKEITWSDNELDKIRKSRTVELNIKEVEDIEYSQIEDIPDNAIDKVLSTYTAKINSIDSPLPASKYRATFTGLTYPEVLDLQNSSELNTIDGERKKWSICFDHIKNQSIGPWEEYQWYIDPETRKKIRIGFTDPCPANIDQSELHIVTKFDDFLMKTSYLDLEFMIWKILCATSSDKEIITITCHFDFNGSECGKHYDWVYNPNDLLVTNSISAVVLEEMQKTTEVSSIEDIMNNYKSAMLNTNNVVTLPSSGIKIIFGHISAYTYLTEVYPRIKEIDNIEYMEEIDPSILSKGLNYRSLSIIKAFLIPMNGKYYRVTGTENLLRIVNKMNEVDWQVIDNLVTMMLSPYQLKYAIRGLECPRCHNKSILPINNVDILLFILAQSLASVNIILKKR